MSRRGVALNTSLININNMSAYYNTNQITCNNHLDITGNTTIHHNLTVAGVDEITHNYNIVNNEIVYTFNRVENNRLTISYNGIDTEITTLNLYIGNTYIFDQNASNGFPDDLIIISKKKLKYNRNNYNIIREPYETGVLYYYSNQYHEVDSTIRNKIKFTPTERGVFYLVSKNKTKTIRTVTVNILDNIYKYGSFITNSGFGLTKNLNVAGNMNVKDGMLYVVNDPQYIQPKAVGVGTTIPRLGFDMTNLTNYNDALKLPKTIGLGTHTGVDAMMRFDGEINSVQGYLENEWIALGKLQDRDKDTFVEPEISPEREDELEFTTNGHKRLTILSDDNTLVGIATIRPTATLEINGNLNVTPDNTSSGIDFCNDTNHTDNYLHVNITNSDKIDESLHFITNNGGYFKDIQNNLIETVNDKTSILNNKTLELEQIYKFTNTDNSSIQINSNTDITISGNFNNTIENSSIETIESTSNHIIHGNSNETFSSSFNINTDGDYLYNINKTRYFNVVDNTSETYNTNYNINITNDLTETITGSYDLTQTNFVFETYKKNYTTNINYNKTSTIQNNFNTLINTNYNLNVKGNTTETYLTDFSKSIKLFHNLDVHGYTDSYVNNNVMTYKKNLNVNNTGFLHQKITINKNNNIIGTLTETYNNSFTKNTHTNNTTNIYKNYAFNINNSYYYNVTANKNITIFKDYTVTTNKETEIFSTGSADNNIFYNSNFDKDVTYNSNRISNLIVYNENDKFINLDSIEIFKKNKFNYLWLYGHPLSGPNTVSFSITNVYLTNYIKIVYKSDYNNIININPTNYVFPGYVHVGQDPNIPNRKLINDWFIFIPSQTTVGTYSIINSYNSNININNIDSNNEYYILGPNDEQCFAIVHKNSYNPSQTYNYDSKFIMGPRKHQLEYNLRTHYIKIFNIGTQSTNISLFSLNNTNTTIQQHDSYDIQQNINSDLSHVGTTGSNEFSRFIFIYIEGTQVVGPHDIITKSKYYIYSKKEDEGDDKSESLVGFLCNTYDNSLGIKSTYDNSCIWTIESVNPNDASYNIDLYYIYNTNSNGDHYIEFHSNKTGIFLSTNKDDLNTQQHFTFYYYYQHFTNITSTLLTYNEETRAHYLNKDFKHIFSQGDPTLHVSSQLNSENKHLIGSNSPKDAFLLIYSNTLKIPGAGIDVGTFKIYNTVTQEYLFNNKSLNWVIESIEEKNESHVEAVYTIKAYNNGNPTHFLFNNNGVLDYTPIIFPIIDTPKFTIENVITNIPPGTYNKKVHKPVIRHVAKTEELNITGNINETYKSRFNINIGSNLDYNIKTLYNINNYDDNFKTLSRTHKNTVIGNLQETILQEHTKFLEKDYTVFYNSNNEKYIQGDLSEDITGFVDKTIYDTNKVFVLNNSDETYKKDYTLKSSDNNKTIDTDLVETIRGDVDILVDKSINIINNSNKTTNITTPNSGGTSGTSGYFMGDAYSPDYVNRPELTLIIDNTDVISINNVDKNLLGDIFNATTYLNGLFTSAGHGNKIEVTNNGSVLILTSKTIGSNSSVLLDDNNTNQIMRLFVGPPSGEGSRSIGSPSQLNGLFSVPGNDPDPGNFINIICLDNNINITKNANIDIKGNKNITISLDKTLNIGKNRDTFIGKFNKQLTNKTTDINYIKDKTNITLHNVNSIVSGDYDFKLNNNDTETYLSNKTTLIDNNLTETIYGSMSLDVTDDITFNDASDFNLSCAQNINFDSNGYVYIINDITNDGYPAPSDKKALVVNGGTYIKRDCYIGGDILISNNLNVFGQDTSALKTEDFEINDPLIVIGLLQQDDNTYSGILSQTFIDSDSKLTGIVRNNQDNYSLLNNINVDITDPDEYSNSDMNDTFSNLHVNKHANFIANKIVSHEPDINTHGDLYIAKNIFLGIVDTPAENVENSFTLNIGTNINSSQNTLKFTSNKNIVYNITNSQSISITSDNNYNLDVINNRHIHTNNNFVETVNGSYDRFVKNTADETYKKNYNLNISNNFTKVIKNNYDKTIKSNYDINHFNLLDQTIKHDYNLNVLQNNIIKFNTDLDSYIGNSNTILYSDSNTIINKDKKFDIHNNCKYNITGTNTLIIEQSNNETYHNTNKTIHNELTETIKGIHKKDIYLNYDSTISEICKETYSTDVTIHTTGSETITIQQDNNININNTLDRTINNHVTETFNMNYNVNISENLNSIVSGLFNIYVDNHTLNTYNKNVTNNITETNTNTYNQSYKISVYENNLETYTGFNCNIDLNYNKNITNSYFYRVHQGSKLTVDEDNTFTNKKYLYTNVKNDSEETYGNTYDKYINGIISDNYKNNKTFNILNNYNFNSNKIYSQHTVGISTSTFRTNYNLNLFGHLKETLYSDITSYIKEDKYEKTKNNYEHFTKLDKSTTINNNFDSTINGYRNMTIEGTLDKSIKSDHDIYITGDKSHTLNDTLYNFVKLYDDHIYHNSNTIYVMDNLHETFDKTLTTIHNTGTDKTTVTNSIFYNNSVCTRINNDYTKNIYLNNDQYITVNLNKTIVGDTVITNNKSVDRTITDNKTKIVNNELSKTIYNNVNTVYKNNKDITISQNNTYSISHNLNNTIYSDLNEDFLSSKFVKKGSDNSTLTNYTTQGTFFNEIKETYKLNIKDDILETYKSTYTKYITDNNDKTINGYYNLNITQVSDEVYDKTFDIIQGSNTTLINNMYSKYIDKNTIETFENHSTHITNNNNVKYIGGTYNLTSNHSSKPNINITTAGNLNITADANINKNNNVNFITRVGIRDIVSYTPQIINTAMITDNNISEFVNSTNEYLINPKTINIIHIDPSTKINQLISGNKNIYIRLNLPEGSYNGQIVKIIVHPVFENTFDINNRLSNGLTTNIAIRINSFCDANENEYVTADLLLNRGGMGLSLIYIDNDPTTNNINDSYWMLMSNSFISN